MREDGAGTAGKNRSQPLAPSVDAAMTDCKDATMNLQEAAASNPILDQPCA